MALPYNLSHTAAGARTLTKLKFGHVKFDAGRLHDRETGSGRYGVTPAVSR